MKIRAGGEGSCSATWPLGIWWLLLPWRIFPEDYLIPDLEEDEFNQRTALEHQDLPVDEVIVYWKHSVEEMTFAIEKIPAEKFPGNLLYPWGDERGDIIQLVKYFIEHDEEHVAEILK